MSLAVAHRDCYNNLAFDPSQNPLVQAALFNQLLIIHERIGFWGRQLRPRMSETGLKIVETRTWDDIDVALASYDDPYPLALMAVGRRPLETLEELDRLKQLAPNAFVLILDPEANHEILLTARALGATHVIPGQTVPPEVTRLLTRWKRLASERAMKAGWRGLSAESSEPEPWNWISAIING